MANKDTQDDTKTLIEAAQNDFSNTRETQIRCVIKVLGESIERVKVSLLLPILMEDPAELKNRLINTSFTKVCPLLDDFLRRRDLIVRERRPPLVDNGIVNIIDFFQVNHKVMRLFPQELRQLSLDDRKLLQAFEMLLDVSKRHLQRHAKYEIAKERKLHHKYEENLEIKKDIAELTTRLHSQKVKLRWKMAAKEVFLNKFEEDLAHKKWQNNVRIQNEIEKCSRTIRANHKASLDKQKELEEELEKARAEYQKATHTNSALEKEARAEKNKLLLQLQSLIKKYDHTMGEKIRENLQLEDEYNEAQKELNEFMKIYRAEQAIYNEIVVKREEEERREQQRRIVVFMINRAARKIQKYWRKWRKDQRKKNKKQKKGKKK